MNGASSPFPDDLVAAQRALHEARRELALHYAALPAAPETEAEEAYAGEADAEQYVRTRALEAQVAELSAALYSHPYWATLSGPELVAAREELKRVEDA
ncbi:hypothetical protein [Streptomyces sp. ODS28]|uniref:hypothetical protein n=1 Tax=Streptomyces sp. ODS28 TaxID=3136688 RepID=UPI0031EAD6B6